MSIFDNWIKKYVVGLFLGRLIKLLDGKKTVIGALSLLLWVAIYAIPAFTPEYNFIVTYAQAIRDYLLASGISLDNDLFNTGIGFTVVGLADKVRKLIKTYKEKDDGDLE
jgi:hypothetical protein